MWAKERLPSPPGLPPKPSEPYPADVRPVVEIAFSFNSAGAYGPLPPEPRRYLQQAVRSLDATLLKHIFDVTSGGTRTRIAAFAHGNHSRDVKKYVIRHVDFTDDVSELCQFVDESAALTWGSHCHCYELVLRRARKALTWTPGSRRLLVMFGCTPPHHGDHDGETIFWEVEARCLAQKGVAVFAVESALTEAGHEFYRGLADITEGCHIVLEQFTDIRDVIMAIVCNFVNGPRGLEEFEEEVMGREDNCYNTDLAQLFISLRQYNEKVMSPPGTPLGSDFGDSQTRPNENNAHENDVQFENNPLFESKKHFQDSLNGDRRLASKTMSEDETKVSLKRKELDDTMGIKITIKRRSQRIHLTRLKSLKLADEMAETPLPSSEFNPLVPAATGTVNSAITRTVNSTITHTVNSTITRTVNSTITHTVNSTGVCKHKGVEEKQGSMDSPAIDFDKTNPKSWLYRQNAHNKCLRCRGGKAAIATKQQAVSFSLPQETHKPPETFPNSFSHNSVSSQATKSSSSVHAAGDSPSPSSVAPSSERSQTPNSSSSVSSVSARIRLRKSQTVALPCSATNKAKPGGLVSPEPKSSERSLDDSAGADGGENVRTSRPLREKAALKRGVTEVGHGGKLKPDEAATGTQRPGAGGVDFYKIDKTDPTKREKVPPRTFALRHLLWSPWTLAISPTRPTKRTSHWEKRSRVLEDGYRRLELFSPGEASLEELERSRRNPCLYEIALKPKNGVKKCVVYHKLLAEIKDKIPWEGQIFEEASVQKEVGDAVRKKCKVFIRRAIFSQHARVAHGVVKAALRKYDYAWNEVQGLKRQPRPVELS